MERLATSKPGEDGREHSPLGSSRQLPSRASWVRPRLAGPDPHTPTPPLPCPQHRHSPAKVLEVNHSCKHRHRVGRGDTGAVLTYLQGCRVESRRHCGGGGSCRVPKMPVRGVAKVPMPKMGSPRLDVGRTFPSTESSSEGHPADPTRKETEARGCSSQPSLGRSPDPLPGGRSRKDPPALQLIHPQGVKGQHCLHPLSLGCGMGVRMSRQGVSHSVNSSNQAGPHGPFKLSFEGTGVLGKPGDRTGRAVAGTLVTSHPQ